MLRIASRAGPVAVIPEEVVSRIESAAWFRSSWSPYALLDGDLRLSAVNTALQRLANGLPTDRLVGQVATEVFDVNPDDPGADASAVFEYSVEEVLRTGRTSWLGLHRHDLPHPQRPGTFVHRVWLPVQVPVVHDGVVVGVLHHVQDLTAALGVGRPAPGAAFAHTDAMALAAERLGREFPDTAPEAVLGVLTDSVRVVAGVLREADPVRSAELARLRLEVLTGSPAHERSEPRA